MWTKRQLQDAMRAEGWRSIGHGAYEHPSGATIALNNVTVRNGKACVLWEGYAAVERTPAPF